jgi:hypothetical protein
MGFNYDQARVALEMTNGNKVIFSEKKNSQMAINNTL